MFISCPELWKLTWRLSFPIVGRRAEGAYLWDIDGNRFVDFANGFGVHLFGHRPAFLVEALQAAIETGLPPLGMQAEQTNEVAQRIAAMTGAERVTFATTGTEAVMAAIRLARAVTGRDRIAMFAHSYHGHSDAVLPTVGVRLGLPSQQKNDTMVLDYGTPQSLELLAQAQDTLAAVLVEPVQARRLGLQPQGYLRELRELTAKAGIALVFDDVLLGFRIHPGGSQAHFGIRADITTFGKVVGGGMPIGVVTGSSRYLDRVDPGYPTLLGATQPRDRFFSSAGTFCKNPLVLEAALAVLRRLEAEGAGLQEGLNAKTSRLVNRLNVWFERESFPARIESFGSLFRFVHAPKLNLLIPHLILRGIYTTEQGTFNLSTAHTQNDLECFVIAVKDSFSSMRRGGVIGSRAPVEDSRTGERRGA
jgi:glutamate-1-semialdehyde aminotransferase